MNQDIVYRYTVLANRNDFELHGSGLHPQPLGPVRPEDQRLAMDDINLCIGCNVAASSEGRELVAKLESLYSVNIAASDDITTAQKGGDMVLETDGIDLVAAYFDEEKLRKNWEGKLGAREYCRCSTSQGVCSIQ